MKCLDQEKVKRKTKFRNERKKNKHKHDEINKKLINHEDDCKIDLNSTSMTRMIYPRMAPKKFRRLMAVSSSISQFYSRQRPLTESKLFCAGYVQLSKHPSQTVGGYITDLSLSKP